MHGRLRHRVARSTVVNGVTLVVFFGSRWRNRLRRASAAQGDASIPRLLFVSHEATRTGAPKIILNLLKYISEKTQVSCETVLHNSGHLFGEFQRYSTVHCLNMPREFSESLERRMTKLFHHKFAGPPQLAICNSMESRFIAHELRRLGLPIVFLIHELPLSYKVEDFETVYRVSDRIVFPVQTVRDSVFAKAPFDPEKISVLPQGLLDPAFGSMLQREECRRQICQELHLPPDAFIVLGCGTLDLRKGIDHFAAIAREAVQSNQTPKPFHFVWVGDGPRWMHSPHHYIEMDIGRTALSQQVQFIGERTKVDPYFVAADAFLLSSRVDPFPCVVHEAMAAGLPVVAFDQSGGAVEALQDGAGMIVPYGDYRQAAAALVELAQQPLAAERIRQRAKQRVHQKYRFADYAENVLSLIEAALSRKLNRKPLPAEQTRARAA